MSKRKRPKPPKCRLYSEGGELTKMNIKIILIIFLVVSISVIGIMYNNY